MDPLSFVKTYSIPDKFVADYKTYTSKLSQEDWEVHRWYHNKSDEHSSRGSEEPLVHLVADRELSKNLVDFALVNYMDDMYKLGHDILQGSLKSFSNVRLNRYLPGSNMKNHVDHIHSLFDGKEKGIPVLSIVGVLNQAKKGGEFLMKGPGISEKEFLTVDNHVIVFPSCFIWEHRVNTVEEGVRDSYVSWAY